MPRNRATSEPLSICRRDVRAGIFAEDWAAGPDPDGQFG
jgi:hypothetical protein